MLQQYLTAKQTELIQWVSPTQKGCSVAPSPNRNHTGEITLKQVSNSPLCNSSPRASTVVPEKNYKKVLRLESTPVLMCILVTDEHVCPDNGKQTNKQKRKRRSLDTENNSVRQRYDKRGHIRDKGTSISS